MQKQNKQKILSALFLVLTISLLMPSVLAKGDLNVITEPPTSAFQGEVIIVSGTFTAIIPEEDEIILRDSTGDTYLNGLSCGFAPCTVPWTAVITMPNKDYLFSIIVTDLLTNEIVDSKSYTINLDSSGSGSGGTSTQGTPDIRIHSVSYPSQEDLTSGDSTSITITLINNGGDWVCDKLLGCTINSPDFPLLNIEAGIYGEGIAKEIGVGPPLASFFRDTTQCSGLFGENFVSAKEVGPNKQGDIWYGGQVKTTTLTFEVPYAKDSKECNKVPAINSRSCFIQGGDFDGRPAWNGQEDFIVFTGLYQQCSAGYSNHLTGDLGFNQVWQSQVIDSPSKPTNAYCSFITNIIGQEKIAGVSSCAAATGIILLLLVLILKTSGVGIQISPKQNPFDMNKKGQSLVGIIIIAGLTLAFLAGGAVTSSILESGAAFWIILLFILIMILKK